MPSRRLTYTGAVALIAGAVPTSTASAGAPVASFAHHHRTELRHRRGDPSPHAGWNGGTATDLYVVYGTVGTHAAAVVDHPITRGVPDTANPVKTTTGTFTVPGDFASMQGYTFNSSGRIVVSGDTGANAEMLTEIRGSAALGY